MELASLCSFWDCGGSSGIVELVLGLCCSFCGCGVSSLWDSVELVLGLWS